MMILTFISCSFHLLLLLQESKRLFVIQLESDNSANEHLLSQLCGKQLEEH